MKYDVTRDALYRPAEKPVFVGLHPLPEFEPEAAGFSMVDAWWLANASHLSYYDEDGVAERLAPVGLELVKFFANERMKPEEQSGQGFLARGGSFAILAFRGTESDHYPDIRTDARLRLIALARGGKCKRHEGFVKALDEIWKQVGPELEALAKKNVKVFYTGHSLGAAMATLAASRRKPAALYSFGSPRVGNRAFLERLSDVPHYRIVNCSDGVAVVPPPIFYRHAGEVHFIDHRGRFRVDPSYGYVLRCKLAGGWNHLASAPFLRKGCVWVRFLADHSIGNYTRAIAASIEESRG